MKRAIVILFVCILIQGATALFLSYRLQAVTEQRDAAIEELILCHGKPSL